MIRIETLHTTNGPEKTDVSYNIVQTIICETAFRSSILSAYGQTTAVWAVVVLRRSISPPYDDNGSKGMTTGNERRENENKTKRRICQEETRLNHGAGARVVFF
ncbi:hypothetical protein QTP88_026219 [Uroleucon formosanum]